MQATTNPLDWNLETLMKGDKSNKHFEDQANLDDAYYECFKGKSGKTVLEHLVQNTIMSATWMASLPYDKAIAHGFAREGQNALVRMIEQRIERGRTQQHKRKS